MSGTITLRTTSPNRRTIEQEGAESGASMGRALPQGPLSSLSSSHADRPSTSRATTAPRAQLPGSAAPFSNDAARTSWSGIGARESGVQMDEQIRSLSARERLEMESELETRMIPCDGQGGMEALSDWLTLQRRRLQMDPSDMGEQEAVFESFMRVLGDDALSNDLRVGAAKGFVQCMQRDLFSETRRLSLEECGKFSMMDVVPHEDPDYFPMVQAFGMANELRGNPREVFHSLEGDLASQKLPLGLQINRWLRLAGRPELAVDSSFDGEPQSLSFARLLVKRQPAAEAADRQQVLRAGVDIIVAIVEDPQLRAQVFAEAESALGTCGDATDEGFSAITRLVRRHQMSEAVKRGEIGTTELSRWALGEFRLQILEQEVHGFISRSLAANSAAFEENSGSMAYLLHVLQWRGILPTPMDVTLRDPEVLQKRLEEVAAEWPVLDPFWGNRLVPLTRCTMRPHPNDEGKRADGAWRS